MNNSICRLLAVLPALPFGALLPAQFLPLPPQSYYEIGKIDWTTPCGQWSVNTELTAAPWDRVIDPSYPGAQITYACRVGGIFYIRGLQHDVTCPDYLPLGVTLPPIFLFGPRSSTYLQINLPILYPGQNVIFNSQPAVATAGYYGAWEFDPTVDCWAARVVVPNLPVFAGTEWAAQAVFLSSASGMVHIGLSRYTRIY